MHFFFSLERILFDNGVTVNVPTRPDLNRNEFGVSRNWNTFIRFDNQLNSTNTWGIRWLREASPQPKQVNETWTALRNAEETDVDQTFLGTLSSVLGSTMVNTLRLSYTSEILHFANPTFLDNGFDQEALLPTLVHPSFEDGQSPTASIRRLFGYGIDDSFSWFVPNKAGDHELKFGVFYNYIPLHFQDFGTENGQFSFSRDYRLQRGRPVHLSGAPADSRAGNVRLPHAWDLRQCIRAGPLEDGQQLHAERGCAL